MPITLLRCAALALALGAPLAAAHPTETAPPASGPDEFATVFEAFDDVAAARPDQRVQAVAAVDIARIEHTQPGPADADPDRGRALGGGSASYYAAKFDGRRTASGEAFDNDALTAAHRTLPFGSKVRVTNPANGKSVVVRINDRGPFHKGRLIDVSHAAAQRLGLVARGHGRVDLALLN